MFEHIAKVIRVIASPEVLLLVAFAVLSVYIVKADTNYLNIKKVFKDYFEFFSESKKHIWIFWGVPALLSFSLIQITAITCALAENLVVFLSILVSSFFAMLSILVSKDTEEHSALYTQVLKETASTVLLEIVLCMASLIITLALIFLGDSIFRWVKIFVSCIDYYLLFVMLLNMLILIKRFKSMIDNG